MHNTTKCMSFLRRVSVHCLCEEDQVSILCFKNKSFEIAIWHCKIQILNVSSCFEIHHFKITFFKWTSEGFELLGGDPGKTSFQF